MKVYKVMTLIVIQMLFCISSLFSQKLKGGDIITNFSFTEVDGKQYEYKDLQHKKVVLAFYCCAACSGSTFRIHELKEEYRQLMFDNFEVIAVFESTAETLKKYKIDVNIPFIVVADPELELHKKFGVEKPLGKTVKMIINKKSKKNRKKGKKFYDDKKYRKNGTRTRMPAEFVLKNSKVLEAYYGRYIGDHLPLFRINQF